MSDTDFTVFVKESIERLNSAPFNSRANILSSFLTQLTDGRFSPFNSPDDYEMDRIEDGCYYPSKWLPAGNGYRYGFFRWKYTAREFSTGYLNEFDDFEIVQSGSSSVRIRMWSYRPGTTWEQSSNRAEYLLTLDV